MFALCSGFVKYTVRMIGELLASGLTALLLGSAIFGLLTLFFYVVQLIRDL